MTEQRADGAGVSDPVSRPPARAGASQLPRLLTVPSGDEAFLRLVTGILADQPRLPADALQERLRRIFPRALVRERALSGEPTSWYVYREGRWHPSDGAWWTDAHVPRVTVDRDGWLTSISPMAADLLGIGQGATDHHFTDFVAAGALDDAVALFGIVADGHPVDATVILRPASGEVIAVELHAEVDGRGITGHLRLASAIDVAPTSEALDPPKVAVVPEHDLAFARYVEQAVERLPEPSAAALALRLRRLYPHAEVDTRDAVWIVRRDASSPAPGNEAWWTDPELPRVGYDAQGLIDSANPPARALLGDDVVGRFWQELVVPGSSDEVAAMLEILATLGQAESRFRMPDATGRLVEFDSFTTVSGETFTTVIRVTRSTE